MNDDKPFIEAILADPQDEAPRLIYADWLEERGDPRGEFLRIEVALANLDRGDARRPGLRGLRGRFQQLGGEIDQEWRALVDRSRIEGCVQFDFECPKQWEQLQRTADPLARFCETCQLHVYHCSSVQQAQRHAARGHCVAVETSLVRKKGDLKPSDFYGYSRRSREGEAMMTLGIVLPPAPTYHVGDRVEVRQGKHRGREGTVEEVRMSLLRATVRIDGEPAPIEVDFDELSYVFRRERRR